MSLVSLVSQYSQSSYDQSSQSAEYSSIDEGDNMNMSSCCDGLTDIMLVNKKLPCNNIMSLIYKLLLFLFYLVNFVFSIVFAVHQDHQSYHIIYIFISLVGLIYELFVIIVDKRCCLRKCRSGENDDTHELYNIENNTVKHTMVRNDYIISSLGEILIYPILICTLYGFINERAWRFDQAISFVFLYSLIMDAFYMKFYGIVLVTRITYASYFGDIKLLKTKQWVKFFTPMHRAILFAILTALIHWFMIGIIGVRIYVDNFTVDKDHTNNTIPDYKISAFSGIMIFFSVYLPIASWLTFITLNKSGFYKFYSGNNFDDRPESYIRHERLLKDPWAYLAIVALIVPFVGFTVLAYLVDYDIEVSQSAINATHILGLCFIITFLLANFKAIIVCVLLLQLIIINIINKLVLLFVHVVKHS